jgi:NTP pyrophosphatase (non-canonical NTP hydrolase)
LELKQILELQRGFDRKLGWNTYENRNTPEEVLDFMEHFVLVTVEELGEIARVRKQYYRDKQNLVAEKLTHELMDIFVYFMQACMALNIDLEKEYLKKLEYNEERFPLKDIKEQNR